LFALAQHLPVGLLIHEVSRSQNDAPQSVGLVISLSQRPLPDKTQHSLQADVHVSGGIRTHTLSMRAAADLRLRLRGHWDRHKIEVLDVKI